MNRLTAGALQKPSKNFMQSEFRKYYFSRANDVEVPSDPASREFGYLNFEGQMIRHISCRSEGEVKALIIKESPMGVFTSVSRYENPSLPIEEKGWKSADLVFDIDASDLNLECMLEHDFYLCDRCHKSFKDKLPSCPSCGSTIISHIKWLCERCIEGSKLESEKLLQILQEDFGIQSTKLRVYYSGHRGFHVHVDDEEYSLLDRDSRAELVEYISGRGLLPRHFGFSFRWSSYDVKRLPLDSEPGWRGRLARAAMEVTRINDSKRAIATLYDQNRERFKEVMDNLLSRVSVKVDDAVTIDLHRIFRMPGTLHEKSSLIKKRYREGDDPLASAVGLDSIPTKVFVYYAPRFTLKGEVFGPLKSGETVLPAYAAAFLVAKGVAEVVQF